MHDSVVSGTVTDVHNHHSQFAHYNLVDHSIPKRGSDEPIVTRRVGGRTQATVPTTVRMFLETPQVNNCVRNVMACYGAIAWSTGRRRQDKKVPTPWRQ